MADLGHRRAALRFATLDLRRYLGLRQPGRTVRFAEGELSPAVTLIAGPNGSGKTTTARALEALLWPEVSADPMGEVIATVTADGASWTAELAGTSRRWWRGGVPVAGPVYCPAADRDRYRLSLHELLTVDDRDLAAGIRRELGGGYSLAEAAQRLGFSSEPGAPRKSAQRLRQALEAVTTATREQADLRRREAELASLREQETDALAAAGELPLVASLMAWREAGRRLVAARRQMAAYDPRIALLRGKEYEQWRDIRRREIQAGAACDRAAAAVAQAEAALARRQAERPSLPGDVLSRCRALSVQLQQAENDARAATARLAGVKAREETARGGLAERLSPEQLARLDRLQPDERLAEAVRAAAEAAVATGVLEHFAGLPALAEGAPDPAVQETCQRGLELLRAWLQESPWPRPEPDGAGVPRAAFVVAVIGAVLALGMAAVVHPAMLFPAVLLGLLAWWLRPVRAAVVPRSRRPDIEAEYGRLGLPSPAAWAGAAVAGALADLARRSSWDAARERLRGEGLAVRAVLEKDAADRARALAACQATLAERLGCALDASPLAVFHLVTRIAAWQDARDALTEADRAAGAAAEAVTGLRDRLVADLAPAGTAPPGDGAGAAALVERLEKERAAHDAALQERDRLVQALHDERRTLADLGERRRDLLQSCGLLPDEEPCAEELLRQWTDLRAVVSAAQGERRDAEATVARCRDEARHAGARRLDLQTLRGPQLAARRETLERAAVQREQLLRDIESTETLVREAKRRHDLEQRLAARDEAVAELVRDRDAGWRALAGQCCVELVASRLELQSSGILRRAQELFAAITCGRYRLLAEEVQGGAAFRARDTETDQVHDLASLSSGTRLQLLLAARLAFIAEKEGDGPMLPLVLDEVLGNSDDERAGTIVEAVIAAARDGRQVFCMTAQADEVGKWQSRLQSAGVPFAVCWLPQGAPQAPAVALAPVAAPTVPAPLAGEDPLAYARRLGVPAPDLFNTTPGSLHLWYVVDAVPALQALLQAGYRTWGPLALFFSQGGVAATLAPGVEDLATLDPARLAARVDMVMLALALARIGRGRPLDRAALQASGTVSERYLDEVAQVLAQVGGDARELARQLDAGAVRGFRRRSLDEMVQWLREHGHIDDRVPLTADELRARLHAGAGAHLASGALSMDDVRALERLAASLMPPGVAASTLASPSPGDEVTA